MGDGVVRAPPGLAALYKAFGGGRVAEVGRDRKT